MTPAPIVKFGNSMQVVKRTRMHIGRGPIDIAQGGHFKSRFQLGRIKGFLRPYIEGPSLGLRRTDHGYLLIGKQGWCMTFSTAGDKGAENIQSFDLLP